jgi:hypothetical protein
VTDHDHEIAGGGGVGDALECGVRALGDGEGCFAFGWAPGRVFGRVARPDLRVGEALP